MSGLWSGRAGSGKIGCQQNYSPTKQKSTVPSKASKKPRFIVSPEARTSKILCKPTEDPNQRLTSDLPAVYQLDEKRALFLAAEQWNEAFLTLLTLFLQGMSRNLSNPKTGHTTGRSGRGGARPEAALGRSGKKTTLAVPPKRIEKTLLNVSSEARTV